MSTRHSIIAASAAFALGSLLLAACGSGSDTDQADGSATGSSESSGSEETTTTASQIFSETDFAQVCRGTGLATATPYNADGAVNPVVMLQADGAEYGYASVTLPDGWESSYPAYESTELVGCLERTAATEAELCEGYQDEDSGVSWSVQLHDSTYALTLRDAVTAEVIAESTFDAPAQDCPMFSFFSSDDPNPVLDYEMPDAEIELFLKSYVTTA
jgi:hypothetical protein